MYKNKQHLGGCYMKKIALLAIPLATSVFLSACGNDTNTTNKKEVTQTEQSVQKQQVETSSYYFTANESGGISKVDAKSNKVVKTIEVDGSVHNVQVSPNDKILGATMVPKMSGHGEHDDSSMDMDMKMNGFALFYNLKTNKLVHKVEVGEHPAHIVFTNNNKYALVTNNESNNVSVIDLSTYKVVSNIQTGNGPHGFRISKDSKFAYIANMGEDTVSVIDLNELKEVKKMTMGKSPVTTGVTSDNKTLVATLNGENSLAIVDLSSGKVDKVKVGTGPAQVYVQSDDKFAFVANQGTSENPSNTVTKVDLITKQVVATVEVGKGAHGVVTSDDNKYVYVTNMFDNTVSVIDNENNKVIDTIKVGEVPNGISIQ